MATYVVAYDLNKETTRPKITAEIKKDSWAKLSESSYAIDTSETPEGVYSRLKSMVDDNDNIYVITLSEPWTGYGPQAVIDWLTERLT
jgi:hypothetical protein